MNIKFSHHYPKLHSQTSARLLDVIIKTKNELSGYFINYDTKYIEPEGCFPAVEKYYELPTGKLLVLVFIGDKLIPFTTVRRWIPKKEEYYRNAIGQTFQIQFIEEE